jgi:hypothetical protein
MSLLKNNIRHIFDSSMLDPKEIIGMTFRQGDLDQSNNLDSVTGKGSYGGIIKDSIGLGPYQDLSNNIL